MTRRNRLTLRVFLTRIICLLLLHSLISTSTSGQTVSGTVRGTVTFEVNRESAQNATIILAPLGLVTRTGEDGTYQFTNVPEGRYQVIARVTRFPDSVARVTVTGGSTATVDLALRLSGVREEVTVTASSTDESTINAISPTDVIDSIELTERAHTSLGEVLEYQPGIAKRSFGPGTSRPVIRGFDGDRVLVLQDNLPISSLGSQSGDHGEPVDVLSLDKVEIVRGPATLLYGSNAIGGVVNTITGHEEAPNEPRGYLTGFGGSTNDQRGGSAGFEFGAKKFLFFANGGGGRTSDYHTPAGRVPNSFTSFYNGTAGFGYFGDHAFFRTSATYDNRLYGVPFAGLFEGDEEAQINLLMRRRNVRFNGGLRNLESGFLSGFTAFVDYTDYQHQELEGAEVGTVFNNDQFNYRTIFEQAKRGRLSGRFGVSGFNRDYLIIGEETLAPPVVQNNFAIFGLEEITFERATVQFGGRVETNRYRPEQMFDRAVINRNFTGFSGSAGLRFGVFENAALVANYSHSYRAPSLEELYNFGPHIGNLTFEIGDANLQRELGNGLDLSFRYGTRRVQAEVSGYYYDIRNFVFLAPTGGVEDGLVEAVYSQADSRFYGAEVGAHIGLIPNRFLLDLNFDTVDARIKNGPSLPRIPPVRARVGFEFLAGGLRVNPEAVFARDQNDLFITETRTAGYSVFNLRADYTLPQNHFAHIFSVNAFNLGDRLYRNHLSFIKELAPEIGRGVRVAYTLRFF